MKKLIAFLPLLFILVSCNLYDIGSNMDVYFLNVGKADSTIIKINDKFILIDTGYSESYDLINNKLEELECIKIDYLFISHFDKDHVGSASSLVLNYEIDNIYTTYNVKENDETTLFYEALNEKNIESNIVLENMSFTFEGIKFDLYAATNTYTKNESNNSSLVIKATYGKTSFLFTGDSEKQRIKELLDLDIKADVLKVPYHGNLSSNSDKFIEKVMPSYSIITSSNEDLENEELVNILTSNNSLVYLTRNGEILVRSNKIDISVRQ